MRKSLVLALAFCAALASAAAAEEMSVTLKSFDATARTIVTEEGSSYAVDEGVPLQELRPGTKLKVTLEERKGKKVVTKIVGE